MNETTLSGSQVKTKSRRSTYFSKIRNRTLFVNLSFIIFGISSFLNWNCILSTLDYFNYYFGKKDKKKIVFLEPSLFFPILNYSLNMPLQFLLFVKKFTSSLKSRLLFSIFFSSLLMISIPFLITGIVGDYKWDAKKPKYKINKIKLSFYFTSLLILLNGLMNGLYNSSLFALVSYFPKEDIVLMSVGQGVSGILPCIIKYIILFSLTKISDKQKKNKINGYVYFCVCALFNFVSFLFLIFAYRHDYFIDKLKDTDEKGCLSNEIFVDKLDTEALFDSFDDGKLSECPNRKVIESKKIKEKENELLNQNTYSFCNLVKQIIDINCLIAYISILSYSLYPGCFNKLPLNVPENYKPNTIALIYNFFDTFGRQIVTFINPNKNVLISISCIRTVFIPSSILILNYYYENRLKKIILNILTIVNIILCSFSGGFGTSVGISLAPMEVEDNLKGKAGNSSSFFQNLGLLMGSIVGIGINELNEKLDDKYIN